MAAKYDVIIIGAGHNGLTSGAYLAKAGKRVLVLEARPVIGGMTTTEATVKEAPGFLMNGCAIDMILVNIKPSIIEELNLARYGLQMIDIDPYVAYLTPSGESLSLWRDLDRTCAEIQRYSRKDAEQYRRVVNQVNDAWHVAMPYLTGHPHRLTPGQIGQTLARAAKHRKILAGAVRFLLMPQQQAVEELFESDVMRTTMALWSVASMMPFNEPASSGTIAGYMLTHRYGCRRPIGGMGALSSALGRCIEDHGGEVRLAAPVSRVIVRNDRAIGVELESGEQLLANDVIGSVDPMTLMGKMVDDDCVPEQTKRELRGLTVGKNNLAFFKADVAISGDFELPGYARSDELIRGGYMMFGDDYQYMLDHQVLNKNFKLGDQIPFYAAVPSALDRTLVPPGNKGNTVYLYVPSTPRDLADGERWEDHQDIYLQQMLDVLEKYSPGIQSQVIGTYIKSPAVFSRYVYNSHPYHADMSPAQMGPFRPIPSMSGFTTPINGLWHASAGNHPFPAVHGWGGRTAARELLRAEARPQWGTALRKRSSDR